MCVCERDRDREREVGREGEREREGGWEVGREGERERLRTIARERIEEIGAKVRWTRLCGVNGGESSVRACRKTW